MVPAEVFGVSMATELEPFSCFDVIIGALDRHHIRVSNCAGGFQTLRYRALSSAFIFEWYTTMEKPYDKWSQAGWRIEQKYGNKVLIGNWVEQKLQFVREGETANSTHRLDFTPNLWHRPDVVVRRKALRRSEGIPTRLLLSHHDVPASDYLVTLYDESYRRQTSSALPALRSWHSDKLAWVPERSDQPIQGPPTNFGLAETWRAQKEHQQAVVPILSVYKASYPLHPSSAFCRSRHVVAPKRFSSSQLPAKHSNQNLALSRRPCRQISSNLASPL